MLRPALFALAAVGVAGAAVALAPTAAPARAADPAHPTVIELYQSQGCSSCPPAIRNLNALADRPDVLTLTFAVTYWDQLGWKDTFASPAQTDRQWAYARGFDHDQVWTPQVIVDGRGDTVGTRSGEIESLLARTPSRVGPMLTLTGGGVAVGTGSAPAGGADIWLVRYDPRTIPVAVRAGENEGRTINHRNVVRQLVKLGRWTGSAATFPLPAAIAGLQTAVIVQKPGGTVLAAVRR